ncbi:hypothetical protein HDU78_000269 [Chytriomyces hyalinus]|nr:hypothetical protein HDU78_000269 [Chytriomyces hyalinus]
MTADAAIQIDVIPTLCHIPEYEGGMVVAAQDPFMGGDKLEFGQYLVNSHSPGLFSTLSHLEPSLEWEDMFPEFTKQFEQVQPPQQQQQQQQYMHEPVQEASPSSDFESPVSRSNKKRRKTKKNASEPKTTTPTARTTTSAQQQQDTIPSVIKSHARTNVDLVAFECPLPFCKARLCSSSHLARHIRTHTGLKPYACLVSGCQRQFSRQDNMMQHFRAHEARLKKAAERAYKGNERWQSAATRTAVAVVEPIPWDVQVEEFKETRDPIKYWDRARRSLIEEERN